MITFVCADPATSLELANPEIGDKIVVDHKMIIHTTKAGEYKIRIPLGRTSVTTRKFDFAALTAAKVTALKAFLYATAGKELTLTDHLGVESTCYILTPAFNIVTRQDGCTYEVGFEFLDYGGIATATYNILTQSGEYILTESGEEILYEH
jgi:hypothetical protein